MKRKSSGTVISLVPSGSLTTIWLASTASTSNDLVSDVVVGCCASDTVAVSVAAAAARTTRLIARVMGLSLVEMRYTRCETRSPEGTTNHRQWPHNGHRTGSVDTREGTGLSPTRTA